VTFVILSAPFACPPQAGAMDLNHALLVGRSLFWELIAENL
jgi:hypothetical protein